ncbi:FAD-binding domain-containing protein [Cladophialophora immunda]|nr:FAD-binding domain-containing protein [Cladophialophora immunda]
MMFSSSSFVMATIFAAAQAATTGNATTSGNSHYQYDPAQAHLEGLNGTISHSYLGAMLGVVALLLAYSLTLRLNAHIRHLASMSGAGALRNVGRGGTKAKFEPLNGGVVKITLTSPRPWTYRPGQSLYLTIPSIGLWTAHPFSVAWSGIEDPLSRSSSLRSNYSEKRPAIHIYSKDIEKRGEETISLIVKKQTGMTNKLWHRAMTAGAGLELNALIEGPYGNERSMSSYGTVLLFASGVGITHQLGYVKELVEGYGHGTVAAKRVTLVWVIPTTECLDWIRPWMHEILSMEGRREVLKVLLYVTRVSLSQVIRSPSEHVQMARGRPDVETLIASEARQKVGCMGISVCAGGGLADEVRRASRAMLDNGVNVDFIEEGFGW